MAKAARRSILPLALRRGDRFTDEEGEWEVSSRPWNTRSGKTVHAVVQRPRDRGTKREKTRPAHERIAIMRA